jgi:hypothetical protein
VEVDDQTVTLTLTEAKAFRAVVMGDRFVTADINSGIAKIDAALEEARDKAME